MGFREAGTAMTSAKILGFGETNSGKTMFGLTLPDSAGIDSEAGMIHYEGKDVVINNKKYNNLKLVNNTADLEELEESLDLFLDNDKSVKNIKTLIIDSETKFYYTMQIGAMEVEEKRARKTGGDVNDQTVSQRQWGRIKLINMKLQQAKIDLASRGIHIYSTSQSADLRDEGGKNIIGQKPDMHKSAKYDYDIVLEFFNQESDTGEILYFARVHKDRTLVTKKGQVIQNCTFDVWKDYFENNSVGKEYLNSSLSNDLKKSVADLEDDAEKQEDLAKKLKEGMKQAKADGRTLQLRKIGEIFKKYEMDMKKLDIYSVEQLKECLSILTTEE